MVYFKTMSNYADQTNVAFYGLVHHKTRAIYRILKILRIGTIQERQKKRVTRTNNRSDTLGIYLMT